MKAIIIALLAAASPLFARIIEVPDDQRTIEDGIDASRPGDTVLVHPGDYEHTELTISHDLTLAGEFLLTGDERTIEETVLHGVQRGTTIRVSDLQINLWLVGLRLTDGFAGIEAYGDPCIYVFYCHFDNNQDAMFYAGPNIAISNSSFLDNGRVFVDSFNWLGFGSSMRIQDCNFRRNGQLTLLSSGSIRHCTFINNQSGLNFIIGTISDCHFEGNSNEDNGGALSCSERASVVNCTFIGNSSENQGGAIYGRGNINISGCEFIGNSSENQGGAIYMYGLERVASITNCTFFGNISGAGEGGDIYFYTGQDWRRGSHFMLSNSILLGGDPQAVAFSLNDTAELIVSYCDIQGGREQIAGEGVGQFNWGEGNFDEDPLFIDPDNGDFHLQAESPCIDAGDPDSPLDPDGTRADIGAFYFPHQPRIAAEPEALDFGRVVVGSSREMTLRVSNVGQEPLTISAVQTSDETFQATLENEVELAPEESFDLSVTFAPETYERFDATLTISSNDVANRRLAIALQGVGIEELPNLRHFTTFTETDINHSLLINGLSFDGEAVPSGWEVGVFTPSGTLGGAGIWSAREGRIGIAVWGDDSLSADVMEGFRAGEYFRFRIWDDADDVEYPAVADISDGPFNWEPNAATILILRAMVERRLTMSLRQNWNMISINVIPPDSLWTRAEGPDVVRLLERLRVDNDLHRVVLIKDQSGHFYAPARAFSNIPYWDLRQGYQAKLISNVEVEWTGIPLESYADVPLRQGWNIIAYLPDYSLSGRAPDFDALAPIIEHVLIAKDYQGRFIMPGQGFSNLPTFEPGFGYQVKVDQDIVLNYPATQENRRDGISPQEPPDLLPNHYVVTRTERNMSLLISDFGFLISDLGELGVFTEKGLCVGATAVGQAFLPVTSERQTGMSVLPGSERQTGMSVLPVTSERQTGMSVLPVTSERQTGMSVLPGSERQTGMSVLLGMAIWGDDPTTEEIDGAREGEPLTFRLWDGRVETPVLLSWEEGEGKYSTDGFAMGEVKLGQTGMSVLPADYCLSAAYPNPFNSSTLIRYDLPEAARVTLRAYDLAGRLTATLVEGGREAGWHEALFDVSALPAGLYVLRLQTSTGFRAVRKAVVVR